MRVCRIFVCVSAASLDVCPLCQLFVSFFGHDARGAGPRAGLLPESKAAGASGVEISAFFAFFGGRSISPFNGFVLRSVPLYACEFNPDRFPH